jgi:hypothetical protein
MQRYEIRFRFTHHVGFMVHKVILEQVFLLLLWLLVASQFLHPCESTGEIVFLHILISISSYDSRLLKLIANKINRLCSV